MLALSVVLRGSRYHERLLSNVELMLISHMVLGIYLQAPCSMCCVSILNKKFSCAGWQVNLDYSSLRPDYISCLDSSDCRERLPTNGVSCAIVDHTLTGSDNGSCFFYTSINVWTVSLYTDSPSFTKRIKGANTKCHRYYFHPWR